MNDMALLLLHEGLCLILGWSCFCRATRTNGETHIAILVSFYLLSITALFAILAPVLIGWTPDAVSLLLVASIALVQTVTARYWQQSPPVAFQRPVQERDEFLDSDRFSDRIPLEADCPTTQPADKGNP